jgi:phage shock protein A
VLREQYKKEYDEIQQKAKIAPDQVDHLQARKLVANIKSLMDAVDKETGQLATIKNNVNQVKSELDALGAYGERMRIDTNAIEEINNLLSALNYKIAKSSEYTKEDSKIIRLHNSLWFVP